MTEAPSEPAAGNMPPRRLGHVVRAIDGVASACLAFVLALTFVSVLLRYVFAIQIPDNYDFARLVTGIFIFWGIASVSHYGEHIQMDALWSVLGRRSRQAVDVFSTLVTFGFIGLVSTLLFDRVAQDVANQTATLNLAIVIWPFHLAASVGLLTATMLLAIRLWRLVGVDGVYPDETRETASYG